MAITFFGSPAIHKSTVVVLSHMTHPLRSTNHLLSAVPEEDFQRLSPSLRTVSLTPRQVVATQGEPCQQVLFPCEGVISLIRQMDDGRTIEVAPVGSEGLIGVGAVLGSGHDDNQAVVQVGGHALALPVAVLRSELARRGPLHDVTQRYVQGFVSTLMQTTACNALDQVPQRFCRWLLTIHDRVEGDSFPMTHESVAHLLGVRRPTITLALGQLQNRNLVRLMRGTITILDRQGLEAASCDCYRLIAAAYAATFPAGPAARNLGVPTSSGVGLEANTSHAPLVDAAV